MFIYLKNIKFLLIFLIVILLNGCSSTNMKDFENKTPKLNLFEFFKGETVAYGIFEDRFGKLRRQFRVKIKGSVEENILTLDEKFIYDDGEKATSIWKIKKINENNNLIKYEGSAEDVEGLGRGSSVGNALIWSYYIYLKIKGSNVKVMFNDWIYKQDSNIAINRAYVSKFGIDIGSVTLVFLRGQTAKTVSPLNTVSYTHLSLTTILLV